MRLPSHAVRQGLGLNMTPLIDVVFLLIIFFLVSSHLARQEAQLELDLPAAETGSEMAHAPAARVTINVLPGGQVMLAGAPVEAQELLARLNVEAARAGDELEVRIRSDRGVPYRFVEPIMLACARAGVWNVTFAVVERHR